MQGRLHKETLLLGNGGCLATGNLHVVAKETLPLLIV